MPVNNRTYLSKLIKSFLCAATLFVVACSNQTPPAAEAVTLTTELQASYDRSCKHCHETPATNSPQTGDIEQWAKVLDKGMEETLSRAINGYQGMPPGGQCFECSPEQLEELIRYMAQVKRS